MSNIVVDLQIPKVNAFPETLEHRINLHHGIYILTLTVTD